MNLKFRIEQIFGLSLLKQVCLMLDRRIQGNMLLGKGAILQLSEKSLIKIINGSLYLNWKWAAKDPSKCFLFVGRKAELVVKGNYSIGSGSRIYIMEQSKLELGSGYANHDLKIDCFESIKIGDGVVIAPNVTIRDSDNKSHGSDSVSPHAPIRICDNVWIGMNSTILKGVTIGSGAIIAAGSLVNKDVAANTLVGGVPARVISTNVSWEDQTTNPPPGVWPV